MTTFALDRQTSLSIFERMLLIRHFEETVIRLYSEGRFASHYHIYIGQEATGSAVLEVLGDKDLICTTHRNHGHIIGRGSDPNRAMAEILGRATGFNGGRSGTLHLCDPSRGFLSTSAIVGGCPGLATGAAYGIKVKREPHVSVGFFGDGALEEGLVIESFNIAALWKLPVVYVCENNATGAIGPQQGGYPTATTATDSFTRLPAAYGIHCLQVDGTDMTAVHEFRDRGGRPLPRRQWPGLHRGLHHALAGQQPVVARTGDRHRSHRSLGARAYRRSQCRLGAPSRSAAARRARTARRRLHHARRHVGARQGRAHPHGGGGGIRHRQPDARSGDRRRPCVRVSREPA